ncbi:MAG: diguanylate cyclase [Acidiphilium sp.]|nr:diguanylate cyclase [Acidiphilium sp.]MDD4935339.1 diguanylate cyclase [Acidiphilium sp.]
MARGRALLSPRHAVTAKTLGLSGVAFGAIAALVGALALASLSFCQVDSGIPAFWPANAVPLALLLARRPSRWQRPLLVIAAGWLGNTVAELITGASIAQTICLPIANCIEITSAIAVAWLPFGPRPRIRRLDGLLKFVVAVGVVGPALGALASSVNSALTDPSGVSAAWRVWFAAHALGNLIFTMAGIVILNRTRRPLFPSGRRFRSSAALVICLILLIATFHQKNVAPLFIMPLLFACLGMIAGFEFTCLGITALAMFALYRTAMGHGPIVALEPASITSRILLLQAFVLTGFAAATPIALVFERRGLMIAQLRSQKAAIVARAARYKVLAEISADTILVTLQDGTILYASPAAERLIGIAGDALTGRSAFDLIHPDDATAVRSILATLGGETREVTAELRLRHEATAHHVWTEMKTRIGQRRPNHDVELVSVVRDISTRRAEEDRRNADLRRLDRLANTDTLTGLANRRRFNDHLDSEWRRALREQIDISLVLIDVDLFKAYNDHYGHPAGDAALRQIASIVGGGALRPADLATRIGGEEFAVILPATFLSGARAVAERIRDGIRDIQIVHEIAPSGFLSVSIGIDCVCPDQTLTPQMLIERADKALYRAKVKRGSIVIAT